MKERLRYPQTRFLGTNRCVSLGSWCPLKEAYCKKHNLYPVHRRGPHQLVETSVVLVHQIRAHKEIALEYKKIGATIVGFDHGFIGDGLLLRPILNDVFSCCDLYIISDDRPSLLSQSLHIPIETVHTDFYTKIKSPPGDTVILMGFPFTNFDRKANWLPSLNNKRQQQNLHQNIINTLNEMDIKWVYKIHPERILETLEYLQIPRNRLEPRKFEKIHCKANVIIQTGAFSATLVYTFYLNKPTILFKHPDDSYAVGASEKLKKNKVYELPWEFDKNKFKKTLTNLLGINDEILTFSF